ncbi:MoxR family ATPase [Lentzea sp. HUAS12]|uniref:AAA family ATPase n=1 Tax=Lentzea sp. HUAS12 TaxID=2951806 RepID=UPI0020A133FC|nr:MoxR family ATPase [Lentzea sp. HUAS12]USX49600.1 MoxR family ATPase [Lentzea sp. HUAS12]
MAQDSSFSTPGTSVTTPNPTLSRTLRVMESPEELASGLDRAGYLPDGGVATAAFLAVRMGRPLFLEGEPGTGKTSLALALAKAMDVPLIRLQCHEGIDATQALYDWDYPRQLMHLRVLETRGEVDEASLYTRRFLLARPLLQALENAPCVLLVDEIDRADDEFEAFLLEVLSENAVSIPEFGEIRATTPPLTVLTSNRTREVHDALKRRCLYHWLEHPALDREVAILRRTLPGLDERLARKVAEAVGKMRGLDLLKPPGVAESLDWARALQALGRTEPDAETLGAVLKYREDAERVIGSTIVG